MRNGDWRRLWILPGFFLGAWIFSRMVLPFLLPFLLGWALAALVEPQIRYWTGRVHGTRRWISALCMTVGLLILGFAAVGVISVLCREAAVLAGGVPGAVRILSERAALWQAWATEKLGSLPPFLARPMRRWIGELFTGGSVLVGKGAELVLSLAGKAVGGISGGAVVLGTAILAGYLISARYPVLQQKLRAAALWRERAIPFFARFRAVFGSWIRAQGKLAGISFLIVLGGFLLLRVEQPVLWAGLCAAVDAVPMLGTGTVLMPMALLSLFWGNRIRALGLLGIWLCAWMTRSVLEPKFIGKQLGLSPLATLFAMYAGFRLWGVPGMILSPMLAVLGVRLTESEGCG